MSETEVDLLIVGGGINGAGIARDAAGRGLSVMLVEKDDLGAHTSSASSKLIHGGLRYLEQLNLRLVQESLAEREVLLRGAPHIVRPLQFIIPPVASSRPRWMMRAGLFLYDHLAGRQVLPATRTVRLDSKRFHGLRQAGQSALAYWDCRVDDSRLVALNALDAASHGAMILTRTELIAARREQRRWSAIVGSTAGDRTIKARALVNAAGPWAAQLFDRVEGARSRRNVRLVKGSHIVLPRLYDGDHALLMQNEDKRVVFAIPFEERFTLVGTTDVEWHGPPADPAISDAEIDYLLSTASIHLTASIDRKQIVWSYSGIRALCDDGSSKPSAITRDYALELDASGGQPPMLSVFGGKITTYRRLAERALDRLSHLLPAGRTAWTKHAVLPGGDIPDFDLARHVRAIGGRHPNLPQELTARYARAYGTRVDRLLGGVRLVRDLGEVFGAGLYAREVDYLIAEEWARSAQDILFRRTKLGLQMPAQAQEKLERYVAQRLAEREVGLGRAHDAA